MKLIITLVAILIASISLAQLKSPAEFLGYEIGEKFTPHWKMVDYFQHVSQQASTRVKLQNYGETYEGRPLMVAFVSSPENISNLEQIRTNNLANAGKGSGGGSQSPVIVWLSYNVHGNEASSLESAMLTIHALVSGTDPRATGWLSNTVVVIDPCLNPDGRDRYANWFNSVTGEVSNPVVHSREHAEPWPGGRTNHYYFDLNRDWAWQTQVESKQRMALYNQWLPQVHVDFHEQGYNSPYYFAPAAEPYHEVITPWQRQFQVSIGRNHARYFDREGWLYFTKEVFDLLYPSYGDTYPTFNGAIGMTYEQAGHSMGGTSVLTSFGDTLTLRDRAMHHFTTGLSTIEISSQNAAKLVSEFREFFGVARRNGVGEYKAFVLKNNPQDEGRIQKLLKVLDGNDIQYEYSNSGTAKGLNYNTGKEENFSLSANDILITTYQPKGAMVKVLFEPNTRVVDSNTYDITAWSLPYAYGLQAYGLRTNLAGSGRKYQAQFMANPAADPYGYVIRWNGVGSARLVGKLLQAGIKLRYTETPMQIGNESFPRGSVIVIRTSNQYFPRLWETVRNLANEVQVSLTPVTTGFVDSGADFGSSRIRPLQNRKIALITGEGTSANASGEIWHFFDQELEYPITLGNLNNFSSFPIHEYGVLILPNGNYRMLNDKPSSERLRDWVSNGGVLITLENASAQVARTDWGIKAKKSEDAGDSTIYSALRKYEDRERDFIPNQTPGSIYKVDIDNSHPLAFGYPNYYYTLKQDDMLFEFVKQGGWNVGVIKKDRQVAGFVGSRLKRKIQDGTIFAVQDLGSGHVVYFADNIIFRSFWENGKLLLCNAAFLVGQ